MELSERIIATLESQGYSSIDEQHYALNTLISPAPFESAAIIYVTDGTAEIAVAGVSHFLSLGESVPIPPRVPYSVTAGPNGCQIVIGEK
jgi:hypothetical protein